MNNMTSLFRRIFVFTVAIVAALVTIGIIRVTASESLQEILLDADSDFWPFTVQNVMWISLFIGFGELFLRWAKTSSSAAISQPMGASWMSIRWGALKQGLSIAVLDALPFCRA